ncbi:hypothetical protein [Spirosoma koreense]
MSESEWTAWDKQIEKYLQAGRLDKLLSEFKEQYQQGLTFPVHEGKRKFDQTRTANKATK